MSFWNYIGEFFLFRWLFGSHKHHDASGGRECVLSDHHYDPADDFEFSVLTDDHDDYYDQPVDDYDAYDAYDEELDDYDMMDDDF